MVFLLTFSAYALEEPESEAMRALRLSCEKHKVGLGCFNYANMLNRKGKGEPDRYFDLGCKYQHSASCNKEKWPEPEVKPALVQPAIESPAPVMEPMDEPVVSEDEESPQLENRISIRPSDSPSPTSTPPTADTLENPSPEAPASQVEADDLIDPNDMIPSTDPSSSD
jgi:hypothetical protein